MKTIVAGSRGITSMQVIEQAVQEAAEPPYNICVTELVSGTARGVDRTAERFALRMHIPIKQFPAQWDQYGKSAGFRRNEEMACYAEALIAIWDGVSRGTKHMIDCAQGKNLIVFVYIP